MNKNYTVETFINGIATYMGVKEQKAKTGNVANVYTVMFRLPEGVTCVTEKKIWQFKSVNGSLVPSVQAKFVSDWVEAFHKMKDKVDYNKNLPKESKEPVMIKVSLKPSAKGMFGAMSAKVNEKGERMIRFEDAMPVEQAYEMIDGEMVVIFTKTSKKFSEIKTRATVTMIAQEINDEEIVWVDGEGQWPVMLETVSRRDNSPIEIGQGYKFIVGFEEGKMVESKTENFSWDDEVIVTRNKSAALVIVEKPLGRVKDYNMAVDYVSDDSVHGF